MAARCCRPDPRSGCRRGEASGWRSVPAYIWVTAADAGEVLRIDPATGRITPVRVGGFPIGIAVAGGAVWFADRERDIVTRIDPRTLRTIGEPIQVGDAPSSLAVAGGYLFVARAESGTITRIDMRSGKQAGIPIRFAQPTHGSPFALTPAGASVWASSFASSTLTRISSTAGGARVPAARVSKRLLQIPGQGPFPRGARVTATIRVPPWQPGMGGLEIGDGAVWGLNPSIARLLRIDPETNSVVKQIPVDAYADFAVGDGSIWLTNPKANSVDRMDLKTYGVSKTIHVGKNPLGNRCDSAGRVGRQ